MDFSHCESAKQKLDAFSSLIESKSYSSLSAGQCEEYLAELTQLSQDSSCLIKPNIALLLAAKLFAAERKDKASSCLEKLLSCVQPVNSALTQEYPESQTISLRLHYIAAGRLESLSILEIVNELQWAHPHSLASQQLYEVFGLLSYLSAGRLFGDLLYRNSETCLNIPDLGCSWYANRTPENHSERRNINDLANIYTSLFTANLSTEMSLAVSKDLDISRLLPLGTVLVGGTHPTIAIPFSNGEHLLVPVYGGYYSSLQAIVITRLGSEEVSVIVSTQWKMPPLLIPVLENAICHILSKWPKVATAPLEHAFLIGSRSSFGHTIINEIAHLAVLEELANHGRAVNLLLGEWDFLSTLEIMHLSGIPLKSFCNRTYHLSSYRHDATPLYMLPGLIAIPLVSRLPPAASLDLLRRCAVSPRRKEPTTAIYLQLDNRKGRRKCLNTPNVVETVFESAAKKGIRTVVIDGGTSIPHYSQGEAGVVTTYKNSSLDSAMSSIIDSCASAFDVSVDIISGLSVPSKLKIASQYSIALSVVPYGSGSMTPIYLLNTEVVIYGSEAFFGVRGVRGRDIERWHVTRYCHPYREFVEKYIQTSHFSPAGYYVDLAHLQATVHDI
ncbi:hypothetical protein [Cyanobium sp. NIES-981]|uniref:hypothetical protein n=1 Tax=Cyanobium sp. NIES-981 TaxID=1851505 RepID=UPI0007DDC2BC|nr:hypothetical protein [Cyanobium sp. NIES-981]SBO44303.1 protein of unknown function [Cyanobium sp. NIES-981]